MRISTKKSITIAAIIFIVQNVQNAFLAGTLLRRTPLGEFTAVQKNKKKQKRKVEKNKEKNVKGNGYLTRAPTHISGYVYAGDVPLL